MPAAGCRHLLVAVCTRCMDSRETGPCNALISTAAHRACRCNCGGCTCRAFFYIVAQGAWILRCRCGPACACAPGLCIAALARTPTHVPAAHPLLQLQAQAHRARPRQPGVCQARLHLRRVRQVRVHMHASGWRMRQHAAGLLYSNGVAIGLLAQGRRCGIVFQLRAA